MQQPSGVKGKLKDRRRVTSDAGNPAKYSGVHEWSPLVLLALFDIVVDLLVDVMHMNHNTWREHLFQTLTGDRVPKQGRRPKLPRIRALYKQRLLGAIRVSKHRLVRTFLNTYSTNK
jgi:hypothetical protein